MVTGGDDKSHTFKKRNTYQNYHSMKQMDVPTTRGDDMNISCGNLILNTIYKKTLNDYEKHKGHFSR